MFTRVFRISNRTKTKRTKNGECRVAISGAGPTLIAIINKKKNNTNKVENAMKQGFESANLKATVFTTKPGKGVQLLKRK